MDKLFEDFSRKLNTETFLDKDKYEQEINQHYSDILSVLTSDYDNYRKYISRFLFALERNDSRSLAYSMYMFHNLFNDLIASEIKTLDHDILKNACTDETYSKYIAQYEKSISKSSKTRFSEFKEFDASAFNTTEQGEIMSLIISLIEEKSKQIDFTQNDVDVISMQIPVFRNLSIATGSIPLFYFVVGQFIERLNTSEFYQIARNAAEETLFCGFKDGMPDLGFFEYFHCYAMQGSTHSAILYANLALYSYKQHSKFIYDRFLIQFISTSIKYYRNIQVYSEAIKIYERSIHLVLSDYEKHNLDHLYFTCLLHNKNSELPEKIQDYLQKEKKSIIEGGSHDATPWLILLYNIKKLFPEYFKKANELQVFIETLEPLVPEEIKTKFTSILFGKTSDLKNLLKTSLLKLDQTHYTADLHYDNERSLILSNRLVVESITEKDAEGFLLAMLIKSDFSLIFKPKLSKGLVEIKIPENDLNHFDQIYPEVHNSILKVSSETPNSQFIWLGYSEGKILQLTLRDKAFRYFKLIKWNWDNFEKLQKQEYFHSLSFNDTTKDHSGVYQTTPEEYSSQSASITKTLEFAKIFSDENSNSLLLVKDMELAQFPHNLLLDSDLNFVGLKKPITNVLSTEWYLKNKITSTNENFTKAIWIPTESGDWTLNKLYSSLEDTLNTNDFKINIETTIPKPIEETINIICSHGARDIARKQVVYPSEVPIFDLDQYVGKGDVLIFFVCHSGSYKSDFLKNNISSIVKTYISKGYSSVIAPFWALHVNIPSIWLPVFLDTLKNGSELEQAVFKANLEVNLKYPHPAAWSAMHLYGNPHLNFKT